jgi:hypothetical protein
LMFYSNNYRNKSNKHDAILYKIVCEKLNQFITLERLIV